VVPIERRVTWQVTSAFAKAVARRLAAQAPERYVIVASKAARKGRIFIDHLRNTRGATAVAPWSVRARPGAPVATPILWEELASLRGGDAFTIGDVTSMLDRGRNDPWAELPRTRQSITLQLLRRLTG
jgi:bifunctional non-homologous end joining protein LigD